MANFKLAINKLALNFIFLSLFFSGRSYSETLKEKLVKLLQKYDSVTSAEEVRQDEIQESVTNVIFDSRDPVDTQKLVATIRNPAQYLSWLEEYDEVTEFLSKNSEGKALEGVQNEMIFWRVIDEISRQFLTVVGPALVAPELLGQRKEVQLRHSERYQLHVLSLIRKLFSATNKYSLDLLRPNAELIYKSWIEAREQGLGSFVSRQDFIRLLEIYSRGVSYADPSLGEFHLSILTTFKRHLLKFADDLPRLAMRIDVLRSVAARFSRIILDFDPQTAVIGFERQVRLVQMFAEELAVYAGERKWEGPRINSPSQLTDLLLEAAFYEAISLRPASWGLGQKVSMATDRPLDAQGLKMDIFEAYLRLRPLAGEVKLSGEIHSEISKRRRWVERRRPTVIAIAGLQSSVQDEDQGFLSAATEAIAFATRNFVIDCFDSFRTKN